MHLHENNDSGNKLTNTDNFLFFRGEALVVIKEPRGVRSGSVSRPIVKYNE